MLLSFFVDLPAFVLLIAKSRHLPELRVKIKTFRDERPRTMKITSEKYDFHG